jgi:cytoskeletal protein RodZ
MSVTLGEKLRQAREERGISISEVAEQTRISALYIESIERDDYRILPGGIFNKGFVKSFARCVGVDEQEALQDYAQLTANSPNVVADEPKTYRSKVLTDDHNSSSRLTTIIFAGVILGLMATGVLLLVKYIQPMATQTAANITSNQNTNTNSASNVALTNVAAPNSSAISMDNLKVEIRAVKSPVSLVSTLDGEKDNSLLTPENPKFFEPKEAMRFSYSQSKAKNVQLLVNDKQITTPNTPENPNRSVIEFEINKDNVQQIFESGQISYSARAASRR